MYKRIISIFLIIALLIICCIPVSASTSPIPQATVEEILDAYYFPSVASSERGAANCSLTSSAIENAQERTLSALTNAGYQAYSVTSDTFESTQKVLHTDLRELGLDEKYSYIIVITGEYPQSTISAQNHSRGVVPPDDPSDVFTFTYNGQTYTMRNVTVTSLDNPNFGKASTVNLLTSSSQELIKNCLNTAISAYISSFSTILGTVASICGLDISKFNTSQSSTLNLNGGTAWTRVFTQVWDTYYGAWTNGSCVEYAKASSYMSGQYYSATLNRYVSVPQDESVATLKSAYYNDYSWRKQNAVLGYLYSETRYDVTGSVKYYYGNTVKITHTENF